MHHLQKGIAQLNEVMQAVDDLRKKLPAKTGNLALDAALLRVMFSYDAFCAPVPGSEGGSPELDKGFKQKYAPKDYPPATSNVVEVAAKETEEKILSEDQAAAWAKIQVWLTNQDSWFVLKGFAGTGKTFLMEKLASNPRVVFTAPTNKAAKVLSKAVNRPVKTIYSFLGLRMTEDEDELKLEYGSDRPYIPKNTILIIDEGSMCSSQLVDFIRDLVVSGVKVMFVGDPMQLPPVGEVRSPCWKITEDDNCKASLRKVVRFDNQLLALSEKIRKCIKDKKWKSPIEDDNTNFEGVFLLDKSAFNHHIQELSLSDWADNKLVAWRNKTVNRYNARIREALGFSEDYCVGDRVLLAGPMEEFGAIVAHTDEEFTVKKVSEGKIKTPNGDMIAVYNLSLEGDRFLSVSIPQGPDLDKHLSVLANEARKADGSARGKAWRLFWDTKKMFQSVRYGYALTAHRVQGSTYKTVYVDQQDILANQERREAFQCLYVAATRPTTSLYTF
jgi:AAA domain/UvrD-like helicase C-terminal domain